MGRIKGTIVKRTSKEIMERYRDKVSSDFNKNKEFMSYMGIQKKTRNSIAGYIARKVKKEEQKSKKK